MLITTDDLNQEDWSLFEYFDKLKEEFPDFKLLAFFTPFWKEKNYMVKSRIMNNPEAFNPKEYIHSKFLDFLKERKEWLSLGMHGLFHIQPEFSLDAQFQNSMFAISAKIAIYLNNEISFYNWCKPPFYQFNEIGFSLSRQYGFTRLYFQEGIINFAENKIYYRKYLNLIDSHVSTGCPMPDRIDKFYENLRLILKGEIKDKQEFHYE